ncbi:inositol monophosphatase 2 [Trichomonascus vanleenenianus]|uniref:inositol monophosphatase family protein n=1 Tax=Trichomonascus vanleenenianus TaxID=2268995 RepID=UPI003ECA61D3
MGEPNLVEVKEALCKVAIVAGNLIKEKTGTVSFDDKKNAVDLVTEVDKAVEALVSSELKQAFPDYQFLGEESYIPGKTVLTEEPTFIVDPIDGTTNFIHRFPFSCISLGFAYKKQPVVGVVYNPHLDQLYSGIKGHGAYLNGHKLPLKKPEPLRLQGALAAIEWGAERSGANYKIKVDTFNSLAKEEKDGGAFMHGFRSLGSAALNICGVASGMLDVYWEGGCYAWDVCAGWVILEECGGRMVSGNPGEWNPAVDSRVYLAVRGGENQEKFIEDFWSHVQGTLSYSS